ncbi:hypothetical protein FHR90_003104 [Endobacter medicaginis]|uniref:Uncharacterized protein n=1 Tax=Endobacter medicaginis TaxID=1181271 RepID=A0A839V3X5_9PROT|nr:hypothetical protein [Endobacter medicaginis]MBB3175250.1 hypothetical protein [Endobacter medicaginis]MCX5476592.1 hypothetical protein [Endobacter medicaginis]NVN31307.1 hypothetical protein [Endobacter medicaginis]
MTQDLGAVIAWPRLRSPRLLPDAFVPTRFSTAADKAKFGNDLLAFISEGFPKSRFTRVFYRELIGHFGFIAHYDENTFWAFYFTSTDGRIDFLREIADWPCWGAYEHTYRDVEEIVRRRVREARLIEAYRAERRREVERHERATLARLQAKYVEAAFPAPSPLEPTRQSELF